MLAASLARVSGARRARRTACRQKAVLANPSPEKVSAYKVGVAAARVRLRQPDLDHQEGDGDREDRIAEEQQAFEREPLPELASDMNVL